MIVAEQISGIFGRATDEFKDSADYEKSFGAASELIY